MNKVKQIEEVLKTEGVFVSTTSGVSMYPMLRDRRDTIVIRPATGRLQKYDVALYKRGTAYILHRVLEVRPEGYVIRGDNCDQKEYDITDAQVLGVLTEFYRDGKRINMAGWGYQTYVRIHHLFFPLRWVARRMQWGIGKILRCGKKGKI